MEKMKLDPELRSKWLEALRSEDYAGREHYVELVDDYRSSVQNFCALGLAAHVSGLPLTNFLNEGEAYEHLEAWGVSTSSVWHIFDGSHSMTFPEFADWLEANSEPRE